jgi:polyphosphate kinase
MAVAEPAAAGTGLTALAGQPERFINREMSWLDFNRRVLAQAEDPHMPLLERLKFLAIHGSNFDEFFQVRVAGLNDQVAGEVTALTPDGRTPLEQLDAIHVAVDDQLAVVADTWESLLAALSDAGIDLVDFGDLTVTEHQWIGGFFQEQVYPVLTPLAVDLGRPFPFISNLSLSLGVILQSEGKPLFARIKVPPILPRFVALPDGQRFVRLEQVIAAHLDQLFPGTEIVDHVIFRVTRNGDLAIDEGEAEDLLEAVEIELRRRRFRSVVRLEVERSISPAARQVLIEELDIGDRDVYFSPLPLGLADLWQLHGLDRRDLKEPSWKSVQPPEFHGPDGYRNFFEVMRKSDVLVHHPYTSFSGSVSEFIHQASMDKRVLAIKLTLYRTSGDTPIVESLVRAAEAGKQVAVVVELKARFDEAQNIEWARRLEGSGVHVAYGLAGLKVHTKVALVVRRESGGIRRYCHVGTGNYNSKTARLYEDFGLFTTDDTIGADIGQLFNVLTGYGSDIEYEAMLVAPHHLRQPLLQRINQEITHGSGGRIIMKMNSLVDSGMIDALYRASQAGVSIDLIVRGICCLRPGVPGLSENIRVRSIVGRYLEHSRCYYFANGGGTGHPQYYIGSADLMPRNLNRRVEAVAPVNDPTLQSRLGTVLSTCLADAALAWTLDENGYWTRIGDVDGVSTHTTLRNLEIERAAAAEPVPVAPPEEPRRRWSLRRLLR